MPRTSTTTVRDLRKSNRARALWELYLHGPLTRQEVGTAAGVSPATVSNLIGDLLEQGVVIEVGSEDSNGGRPRGLLEVNPEYGYVIGVDVGETAFLVELFDLGMQVRASHVSTTELARLDPADAVNHVLEGIEAVIAESGRGPGQILGVGVGVPGLVEHGDDGVVYGQSVGWEDVPFGRDAAAPTGPAAAGRQRGQDPGPGREVVRRGPRRRQRGHPAARDRRRHQHHQQRRALSRRHQQRGGVGPHQGDGRWPRTCRCGASGCLEAYVGAGAIVTRYDELKRRKNKVNPSQLEQRISEIVQAPESDKAAVKVLEETAIYLGAGIADLVNLFNPERVVIGGWLGHQLAPKLLPRIREVVAAQALRLPAQHVEICAAELGADAVALGAATLPIANVLSSGAIPATAAATRTRSVAGSRAAG